MVVIWAANYSVVKLAISELQPRAFNTVRMVLGSTVYFGALWMSRQARPTAPAPPIEARDWWRLAALGVIGHFIYQICFMGGLSRTTVANSSLILGCSPVVITLLSAAAGHDRVGRWHWIGAALSAAGVYLIVGRGAAMSGASAQGDLLSLAALVCWSAYTVGARPLLLRHSPLVVSGYPLAIGTFLYALTALPVLVRTDWAAVSWPVWGALVFSSLLALNLAYWIWYVGVQRLGSARASIYGNLIPVVAVVLAALWMGERIPPTIAVGAVAIVMGITLARLAR